MQAFNLSLSSTLDIVFSVACDVKLHSAISFILKVILYQVKMLMLYNVQLFQVYNKMSNYASFKVIRLNLQRCNY